MDKPLESSSLQDFVKGLVPNAEMELDSDGERNFTLINTNAAYDPRAGLNHWVPAVSLESLGAEYFAILKKLAECQAEHQVTSLEADIAQTVQEHKSEKDPKKKDCLLTTMASLDDQLAKASSWKSFLLRCLKVNILPVEVPGDGNCLIWLLKCLLEGNFMDPVFDSNSTASLEYIQEFRKELAESWLHLKNWRVWQQLFRFFHLYERPSDDADLILGKRAPAMCETPTKKRKSAVPDATPPEKQSYHKVPKAKAAPRMIDSHEPAPGWMRRSKPIALQPQKKRAADDVKVKVEPGEDAEINVPVDEDAADMQVVESKRRRCAKRKTKTVEEKKLQGLRCYISKIGLSYGRWMEQHWNHVGSKKAGCCGDGKFTDLQRKLALLDEEKRSETLKCVACKELLRSCGYDHEAATRYIHHQNVDEPEDVENKDDPVLETVQEDVENGDAPAGLSVDTLARSISVYYEAGLMQFL